MNVGVLAASLADVLSEHFGRSVGVDGLRRLSGGSSHETWGFVATADPAVPGECGPAVLRREFDRGLLDTDVRSEHDLLAALHGAGLPVPRPWLCVTEDSPLGQPFMVMERVAGSDLRKDLARPNHGRDPQVLGRRVVELQARLHAVDPATMPGLGQVWGPAHEIRRWTSVILDAKPDLDPLLSTAIAWLHEHLPDDAQPCVVHGDFKANNLLITANGDLTVIDWELAHLGDPIEDLAWTMLWRTQWDVVGGLHTAVGYLEAYVELTGRRINSEVLRFWRVFALVKLWAMFATGMAGQYVRPTLRLMGRASIWVHAQIARELLAAAAA